MSDAAESSLPRRIAALVLAGGFAVMLALNLPGQLSYDSIVQLADARSGHYNSWHPAAMDWLLAVLDALLPGTALFVLLQAGLLAIALALTVRRRAGWGAPVLALCLVLTPQFLLYQGTVWKDILFADAALAAFAALGRAADDRRLLLLFFPALTLAGLMRQNGLLLLPASAATLGLLLAKGDRSRALCLAIGALVLLLALTGTATLLLARHGDGGEGLKGEVRLAQTYDLTGAARLGFPLDRLARDDAPLARAIARDGVAAWSPRLMDTLEPSLGQAIHDAPSGVIAAQWRYLVLHRPDLYLRQRAVVFWQVLATPQVALCHPAFAGVDGPPDLLKTLGMAPRRRPSDRWLAAYARAFMGTPVLSHLVFGALAMILLVLYGRRRARDDIAMAGLLAGALVYTVSFFFVSVACDYRYLYLLDMAAMLAALRFVTELKPYRKNRDL